MKQKNKTLQKLKLFYLLLFVLGALIIIPAHAFPPPTFMYARFPHYLETMKPFLGVSWPMSFEIYHYGLYALILIGSLNIFGILLYPKLRKPALFSSLIGIFLIFPMILFLFFIFINVNALTAVIYGQYCVLLLIVDLLTFKVLIKKPHPSLTRRKEASRG